MHEKDIAAIKARWAYVPAPPWEARRYGLYSARSDCRQEACLVGWDRHHDAAVTRAIAAAPQDIATLLAALEARDAELARLRRVEAAARALSDAEHAVDAARETYSGAETARAIDEAVAALCRLRAALDGSGSDV
jgi:hypothetical protein